MIEIIMAYASGGQTYPTLEDAQVASIHGLLAGKCDAGISLAVAKTICEHRDEVIDILTTTPTSKPKARAINGVKRKRRTKAEMFLARAAAATAQNNT